MYFKTFSFLDALVAQSVEQLTLNQLVAVRIRPRHHFDNQGLRALVAQSVEQLTLNQLVDGSNPPRHQLSKPPRVHPSQGAFVVRLLGFVGDEALVLGE